MIAHPRNLLFFLIFVTSVLAQENRISRSCSAGKTYTEISSQSGFPFQPNDPDFPAQSALREMRVPEAWDITTGDSTIIIGILDTGIDLDHPDLQLNIYRNSGEWGTTGELSNNGVDDDNNGYVDDWQGWDFIGAGNADHPFPDNIPQDYIGRGTNVAGCASAVTNNGTGIASPGFRTKLLPVKVTSDTSFSIVSAIEGIHYATDFGCAIIVCGWVLDGNTQPELRDAINYAFDHGCLVVAAAPVPDRDFDVQANYQIDSFVGDGVIQRALYVGMSSQGGTYYPVGHSVDVYAPGYDVLSTGLNGGYDLCRGTYAAAGLVSGVAALVFAVHPDWSPDMVAAALIREDDRWIRADRSIGVFEKPAIRIASYQTDYLEDGSITETGQTVHVSVEFENVGATTHPGLSIEAVDGNGLEISNQTLYPGSISHGEKFKFEINVHIVDTDFSGHFLPLIFHISDTDYVHYELIPLRLHLNSGFHGCWYPTGWRWHDGVVAFVNIDVMNEDIVWAAGVDTYNHEYFTLRTTDAGQSWNRGVFTSNTKYSAAYPLVAVDASHAMVGLNNADSAFVCRTSDDGNSWEYICVSDISRNVLYLHMFNDNDGLFIGHGIDSLWGIAKTSDGGQTWIPTAARLRLDNQYPYLCADFFGDYGWFGNTQEGMYKTTDRGETWMKVSIPLNNCHKLKMRDNNTIVIHSLTDLPNAIMSTDAGITWNALCESPNKVYTGILSIPNEKAIWLFDNNAVIETTDSGANWRSLPMPFSNRFAGSYAVADGYSNKDSSYAWIAGEIICKKVFKNDPISTSVSLLSNVRTTNLNIFPNPVHDGNSLTISISKHFRKGIIYIVDILGREIFHRYLTEDDAPSRSYILSTDGLNAGVYSILFYEDGSFERSSFIKLK